MVTDHNQIHCGDHFEMYRNIDSLCWVTGTNIGQPYFKNKLIEKEIYICGYQRRGVEGGWVGGLEQRWSKGTNVQF